MKRAVLLMLMLLAAAAGAQVRPQPGAGDPRLQTVDYDPAQIIQLQGAPGYQLTVELSPDEQVQNVAVGDGGAWQVNVNRAGDRLFIKPLQTDAATNMTVITSVRVYNFELIPLMGPAPDMAWNVRFRYPAPAAEAQQSEFVDVSPNLRRASRYRVSGDRYLWPSSVTDDGKHTYISWPQDRPIPAVYEIAVNGGETLANGGMRGDEYVVDGVSRRLIFRIDQRVARADKLPPKRKR